MKFKHQKKEQLQNSSNRKAKSVNPQSKKLHNQQQKSIKKNLSSVFTPISDGDGDLLINLLEKESIEQISSISEAVEADQSIIDMSLNSDLNLVQLPEESVRITPISEAFVFDEDQSSIESYIESLNQYISPSFATASSIQVTPLSSISNVETPPSLSTSSSRLTPESTAVLVDSLTRDGATAEETRSIKLESLVKQLRVSMFQVLHSADINPQYKKLMDALLKMVIEEFCNVHDEKNMIVELFSKKVKIAMLSFLLGILAVSACYLLFSDAQSSYHGLRPT